MIIAKITQDNLELTIQEINIPYQHSQGLEIEFIRDIKYKDYTLLAFYKLEGDMEAKLMECNNDIISIAKDVFKKIGKVSFSFSLTRGEEVIHLGVVDFYVRRAFGGDNTILPKENNDTWMDLIGNVAKDGVDNYWNTFYKEQMDNIVNDINSKVSDASSYASQADLAKTEASKSATNASNSASNALTNANKAKEHLDSIVEKTNAFNADYINKVNSFNSNVENANTDIDKKITDANTSMDAKVTEATTQANIATDKATELKDAVDKVNYLEDVVDTKLTQPYVSSPVIENGTISDSDEGQLRNLRVYGKCTQKVEENIVPTLSRPVPIVSKKIVVDGETVELRSLKESVNLFDLGLLSKTELIPKTGAYRKIDIPLQLKPSTKYTFSYDPWEVPALSWIVLKIVNTDDTTLAGVFNYKNNTINAQVKDKINTTFTTDATGKTYFSYYVSEFNEDGSSISQSTSTFERLWFTKLLKNIMLVEGTTVPSSYVAATTRDYKIVDQVSKRSWIERNVIQKNLAELFSQRIEHTKFIITYVYTTIPSGKNGSWNNIFCNNFAIYPYSGFPTDIKEGIYVSTYGIYVVLDDKRNVTTIEEYNEWIKNNPIIVNYQLATPSIEQTEYSESDTSEFGVSFQDTTSPSPTLKSEIETVNILNVKACGKNLLPSVHREINVGGLLWTFNGNALKIKGTSNYQAIDWVTGESMTVIGSSAQVKNFYKDTVMFFYKGNIKISAKTIINNVIANDSSIALTIEVVYDDLKNQIMYMCNRNNAVSNNFILNVEKCVRGVYVKVWYTGQERDYEINDIQMELGNKITDFEPYNGTAITHTLKTPLVKCGDVADTIDLNNLERTNNNYFGILDLAKQSMSYASLVGNYRSYYWRANTMPKPKLLNNNFDKNNLICSRFVADLNRYNSNIGETLSIYKDGSADFVGVFNINRFKDVAEFKQFFVDNPTVIAYPLATPTVEPLEPELIEKLKTLMSFYPITHIFSNVPIEFDYKLNMPAWHKVISGEVENAKDVIYNMQVQQNNLEVMQLESALETQYNLDLLKLQGGI